MFHQCSFLQVSYTKRRHRQATNVSGEYIVNLQRFTLRIQHAMVLFNRAHKMFKKCHHQQHQQTKHMLHDT